MEVEEELIDIFAPAIARGGSDLQILLHDAVLVAGHPVLDACLLFPAARDAEERLYASSDFWSEAERSQVVTRLRVATESYIAVSTSNIEDDGSVFRSNVRFAHGSNAGASEHYVGMASVCTYQRDGVLHPGAEVLLVAFLASDDRIESVLRARLPDPTGTDVSGILTGVETLCARFMSQASGRDDGVGPGRRLAPLDP